VRPVTSRISLVAACLAAAVPCAAGTARAQDALEQAENAYLQVDFESTLEHAIAALESGGNGPRRVTRVFELMGIAAAALEREEVSRQAYIRMLALDPEAEVDQNLAPRLRSTFLEARGFWTARSDRLAAEAAMVRSRGAVKIEVTDPLDMAVRVRVGARIEGESVFQDVTMDAGPAVWMPLEGLANADRIEYFAHVLDEHGNRIVELGGPDEPRVLGRSGLAGTGGGGSGGGGGGASGGGGGGPSDGGSDLLASPVFWGVLGGAAVLAGIVGFVLLTDTTQSVQTDVTIGIGER